MTALATTNIVGLFVNLFGLAGYPLTSVVAQVATLKFKVFPAASICTSCAVEAAATSCFNA